MEGIGYLAHQGDVSDILYTKDLMERMLHMGIYRVDEQELKKAIAILNYIYSQLERCDKDLSSINHTIQKQSGLGIQRVKNTINTQKEQLRLQKQNVAAIRDCVQSIIDKTVEATNNAKHILEEIDLSKPMKDPVLIPSYAFEYTEPDANGIYSTKVKHRDGTSGGVCERNVSGEISCTYYTLRRLKERGMSFPCVDGPGNGGQWYGNFDFESGLPAYGGVNALRDMVSSMSLPQNNVVVSFDQPSPYGHVMLIDEIYREADGTVKIVSSDMWPDITTLNGSNPPTTRTIDEFYSWYNRYNGNMVGLCVLGNK